MENKIDLIKIMKKHHEYPDMPYSVDDIKNCMKEAINQALILASKNAKVKWYPGDGSLQGVDKESILSVNDYVV